jgi:hypothetical protein
MELQVIRSIFNAEVPLKRLTAHVLLRLERKVPGISLRAGKER